MSMENVFEHRYSRDIERTVIAVLGIYPPPIGGVSIHIQRVIDVLVQQHNKVHFFNTEQSLRWRWRFGAYLGKLMFFLMRRRPARVYFHSSYVRTSIGDLLALVFMRRFFPYHLIVVEHDCRHMYRRSRWFKKLYQWVLRHVDEMIFIGHTTYNSYRENGMEFGAHSIEGAFLPPVEYNAASIVENYPSSLTIFLRDHTPIILANASNLMLMDGKDVYGLDACIGMIAILKQEYPDVGLVIALASIGNEAYNTKLRKLMMAQEVSDHIYILHNNQELWPLFGRVDMFVRPTISDAGASISLQEALYFKVPVVASDVCARPGGAMLYQTGNTGDFSRVVNKVLRERVYKI